MGFIGNELLKLLLEFSLHFKLIHVKKQNKPAF